MGIDCRKNANQERIASSIKVLQYCWSKFREKFMDSPNGREIVGCCKIQQLFLEINCKGFLLLE